MSNVFLRREEDHLLREIKANPDDDLPRLAYADLLEERGQVKLATFIRLQLELANQSCSEDASDYCNSLMTQLESLCGKSNPVWLVGVPELTERPRFVTSLLDGVYSVGIEVGLPYDLCMILHRGFVSQVNCSLACWRQYGPALVRAQPVVSVALLDKEPLRAHRGLRVFWYHVDEDVNGVARIPEPFYSLMSSADEEQFFFSGTDHKARHKYYSGDNYVTARLKACTDLSRAVLLWARSQLQIVEE